MRALDRAGSYLQNEFDGSVRKLVGRLAGGALLRAAKLPVMARIAILAAASSRPLAV
jgi:hypothetical protein